MDLFRRAKFEPCHFPDYGRVEFASVQRLARDEVRVRRMSKRADHPWMRHDLGESGALLRIGNEHAGEEMFAF